ncbi:atp-dependent (s)-nad(p)h-hydrate dehydratase family member [Holotrichia oblita]|uniref:Atp-dependent (S)-nad(P)h-hydrate dehydratase family member n=1 Tax=Holotrichia oblita TaxID=644536 RepID=A0ACB9T6Q3_HOLOL|nr:atp-dependent (s)-nad(p)h-hydrate dehydratase family member [Holotrichia oblita]
MPLTLDQEKFLLEAYFRSGERDPNGQWKYSTRLCIDDLTTEFPDIDLDYESLSRHVLRTVERFRNTGSVAKGKSSGRRTVLNDLNSNLEAKWSEIMSMEELDNLKSRPHKVRSPKSQNSSITICPEHMLGGISELENILSIDDTRFQLWKQNGRNNVYGRVGQSQIETTQSSFLQNHKTRRL